MCLSKPAIDKTPRDFYGNCFFFLQILYRLFFETFLVNIPSHSISYTFNTTFW